MDLWLELRLIGGLGGMNVTLPLLTPVPCSPQFSAEAVPFVSGLLAS